MQKKRTENESTIFFMEHRQLIFQLSKALRGIKKICRDKVKSPRLNNLKSPSIAKLLYIVILENQQLVIVSSACFFYFRKENLKNYVYAKVKAIYQFHELFPQKLVFLPNQIPKLKDFKNLKVTDIY